MSKNKSNSSPLRQNMVESFKDAYEKKDYYTRYVKLYIFSIILAYACLAWSALSSFKFFQYYLNPFEDPFWSSLFAGFVTILVSVIIGALTQAVRKDFYRGQWDLMTTILTFVVIAFMVGNVVADLLGSPELASSWTEKPVDTKTTQTDNVYDSQINDAKADIKRYQDRIAYVKGACKSEDCWVDGGKAYWKGNLTQFGKREIRAMQANIEKKDQEISDIRKAWNSQRDANGKEYASNIDTYNQKLTNKTTTLRGVVIVLLIIYILCVIFQGHFGATVSSDDFEPIAAVSRPTVELRRDTEDKDRDKDLELDILYQEVAKLKKQLNGTPSGK